MAAWDLTALVNAADPRAPLAERHLWLARLAEWLRHAPERPPAGEVRTPLAVLRLKHLLNVLDAQPLLRERVRGMVAAFWREVDAPPLFADLGFGPRHSLASEVLRRLGERWLPATPETADLADLFRLVFEPADADWVEALDEALLARLAALVAPGPDVDWRASLLDAITIVVSQIHASGFAPALRLRMDARLLADRPFAQLPRAGDALRAAFESGHPEDLRRDATFLRALLDRCRRAAASVTGHLTEYGVSVNIVFEQEQLRERTLRVDALVDAILADDPRRELQRLVAALIRTGGEQQGLRRLLARQYSLLAREVAERSAETGEHYITRDRAEYRAMVRRAAGGGLVIAGTTFVKFGILALGLPIFWGGFWAGVNYAASFVLIMLLHWTVATKQPAMTAPAMAAALDGGARTDEEIEAFVDKVAQLIRSQAAGILGNVLVCGPLVLLVQLAFVLVLGTPPVGDDEARHVLETLGLVGPTPLYAALTGVLLFASSLVAGWSENFFVFHRLASAIAWNPRIVATLGAARARRWAGWARGNVSGLAANVSLGLMLGLVPAIGAFFGLPLEVRHVTLSAGQLGAAAGALGVEALGMPALWSCLAALVVTAMLNVGVSFWCAFKVALRSRGVRLAERERIEAAIRARLRRDPASFLWPPR